MKRAKDSALILRRQPFGEADLLLTLLTREHGKLKVLAKGARKPTSRLVGHTELFSVIAGQLNFQSKIPILSQVDVVHSTVGLAEDGLALQRISLLAEIVDKATEEGQVNLAMYELLVEGSLRMRQEYQSTLFIGLLIRLLGLLGYAPEVTHCVTCKTRLTPEDRYGWDHEAGGVIANECLRATTKPLDQDTLKAIRHLQRQPVRDMGRLQTPSAIVDELYDLLINYVRYVLEQPLLSVSISYSDEFLVRN
jgi:DNA repair protein RecO (recombination protein O)